uniref:ATP synthase F0 subunit 8 n=1 Tax=Gloydius shedaoensis TaxID=88083 RepID=A0A120IGE5_GLOSH|nr:ATP synthase F0 subunit 8 [Gloydius shedaoensis]
MPQLDIVYHLMIYLWAWLTLTLLTLKIKTLTLANKMKKQPPLHPQPTTLSTPWM